MVAQAETVPLAVLGAVVHGRRLLALVHPALPARLIASPGEAALDLGQPGLGTEARRLAPISPRPGACAEAPQLGTEAGPRWAETSGQCWAAQWAEAWVFPRAGQRCSLIHTLPTMRQAALHCAASLGRRRLPDLG